jgi:hypothetical protein
MTVVSFVARFTPTDIGDFYRSAAPRLRTGSWGGVARSSGAAFDQLVVLSPGRDHPAFTFERDATGSYRLWVHRSERRACQLQSETALDCLDLLQAFSEAEDGIQGDAGSQPGHR